MAGARSRAGILAAILLVAVVAGVLLWSRSGGELGASARREAPSGRETIPARPDGGDRLESGQTLAIGGAEAAAGLDLELLLVEPSEKAELEGRVVTEGRVLPLVARVADDRMSARIALPPGWLTPGRYIVEIRTTERNPLPLRRYAILVSEP